MIRQILADALELARAGRPAKPSVREVLQATKLDGFAVLATTRARDFARRWHIVGANHFLRLAQTAIYGIEIGSGVRLGAGVYFVHPLGTVLGGDARIGDRVRFLGGNTVGTAREDGYPTIEDDVVVGCGARILGPVRVGRGAVIGANAVVLDDVPAGALAAGVPAVIRRPAGASYGAEQEAPS
jgi:serine O-acetyltransferase